MWLKTIVIVALLCGASRWQASTDRLHSRLEKSRLPTHGHSYNPDELRGLPAPVQRCFRTVLTDRQPLVAGANVKHSGAFDMGEKTGQSRPFTSSQRVVTQRQVFSGMPDSNGPSMRRA
jgi:hypothetical protein